MRGLGVSAADERLYRLILRQPGTAITDPEAVERLVELGLLHRAGDGSLRAVDPQTALDRLIQRRLTAVNGELSRIAAARSALPSLLAEQSSTQPVEMVERLDGQERAQQRIWEVTDRMSECLAIAPLRTVADDVVRERTLRRLAQGVVYRSIVHRRVLERPAVREYLHLIHAAGDHHRVTDEPVQQLLIVDRVTAFAPIEPGNPAAGALMIRQPGLVTMLIDLFEQVWSRAEDLVPREPGPTAAERQVLDLLNQHGKDETAARAMGVSLRTFRARVASVMAQLEATNRFQAGVRASERGWIR